MVRNRGLEVKRLSENAVLPTRAHRGDAGYDLASAEDRTIPASSFSLVATDLAIRVPSNTYGRIAPRSGLALKYGITTGAGVIDASYRGSVGVILFNHGKEDFIIQRGDRIAQVRQTDRVHNRVQEQDFTYKSDVVHS